MAYILSALLLAGSFSAPSLQRFVVAIPYTSIAVAQANLDENTTIQSTGLAEAPMVGVKIVYADMVVTPASPVPLHFREFTNSKASKNESPWNSYVSAKGRAKGMMTTREGTAIVWWVD